MPDGTHELMKRAMAMELGIVGIEDPAELKRTFEARWATMDAAQRVAFEMRLGQLANQVAAGGPPSRTSRVIAYVLGIGGAWFVWKPLAVLLVLVASAGAVRRLAVRNAAFWVVKAAVAVGVVYGCFVAALIELAMAISSPATLGRIVWGVVGLMAAAYVGYGVQPNRVLQTREDEMRIATQGIAIGAYLLTLLVWYLTFRRFA
jgi:hypothetical protein